MTLEILRPDVPRLRREGDGGKMLAKGWMNGWGDLGVADLPCVFHFGWLVC